MSIAKRPKPGKGTSGNAKLMTAMKGKQKAIGKKPKPKPINPPVKPSKKK